MNTMTGTSRIPCDEQDHRAPTAHTAPQSALDKKALRATLAALRSQLEPAHKAQADRVIGARVAAWWRQCAGQDEVLGVYWPLRGEPDLSDTYAALAAQGVQLALPVVLARDAALGFAAWSPGEPMVKDSMGVAVPAARRMLARPPLMLVPCLGFNAERFRLGYGGGYYDRTLEAQPRPRTAGVAYACQLAHFASAAHDVALDTVITEA